MQDESFFEGRINDLVINFKIPKDRPFLVYFDQNIWINIAKSQKSEDVKFLDKLIKKIDDGIIRVCINLSNLVEVSHIKDRTRREALCRVIYDISRGWSFLPFIMAKLLDNEIYNSLSLFLGMPYANPRSCIKKGNLLGELAFDNKVTGEKMKEINDFMGSREYFNAVFFNQDLLDKLNKDAVVREKERYEREYGSAIEDMRNDPLINKYGWDKLFTARDVFKYIIPRFKDLLKNSSEINTNFFRNIAKPFTVAACRNILKYVQILPSFNTYVIYSRVIEKCKVEVNNMFDINSFSFVVPYFDCVVGERRMINVAKDKRLDKMYRTTLITDIDDLFNWLDNPLI